LKIIDNIEKEKYEKSSPKNELKSNVKPKIALLEKKFSQLKYDDKYSSKCLTKDLLDFMELTKEYTSVLRETQEMLVGLVQEATNETLLEYEVKLYGSHATNLCLPSSDIDLVLIPTKNNVSTTYPFSALQKLYFNICVKMMIIVGKTVEKVC
jgi:DNA polymerase sigma